MEVVERIRALLTEQAVPFRELHHEPTRTSEDSARLRGESIARNQRIAFNAGSLTDSIFLSTADYLRVASPKVFRYSK